jgi:hypothetical protein
LLFKAGHTLAQILDVVCRHLKPHDLVHHHKCPLDLWRSRLRLPHPAPPIRPIRAKLHSSDAKDAAN